MGERKKILVVDDDDDLRTLLVDKLAGIGYEAYQAITGEEGFFMAKSVLPDLIISDIIMPKMDGNQLFKQVRNSDFGQNIPFIVLTARSRMRDYFEVVAVDDFLEKPFEFITLAKKIEKLIKKDKPLCEPLTTLTYRKILIVGQDTKCVEKMADNFKAEGWHPDFVSSGVQVISKAVLFLPTFLLIDVYMEDMPTREIIKIIRTMPQFQAIPVFVYSSDSSKKISRKQDADGSQNMEAEVQKCLEAGADLYIERIDEKNLISVANRYLRLGILLVVDSNEAATKALKIELEVEGAKVFVGHNAKTGMKFAREILPNLILLDIALPDMDGYDFLKYLKAEKATKDISVIAYKEESALEKGEIEKGLNHGVDDFIPTPFNGRLLVKRIQTIVDLKRKKKKALPAK